MTLDGLVSIRFEIRGGFRQALEASIADHMFQSALRFAVVSDVAVLKADMLRDCEAFQSALRFAVVSDFSIRCPLR